MIKLSLCIICFCYYKVSMYVRVTPTTAPAEEPSHNLLTYNHTFKKILMHYGTLIFSYVFGVKQGYWSRLFVFSTFLTPCLRFPKIAESNPRGQRDAPGKKKLLTHTCSQKDEKGNFRSIWAGRRAKPSRPRDGINYYRCGRRSTSGPGQLFTSGTY